jgi:serine/threonine protein kinase
VILDFGLAREFVQDVHLTQEGQVFGTPTYMSPEQARAQRSKIGPSTDIYSLGVILYELIAGRPPFQGSMAEVFAQILTQEPEPPSKHQPDLDPIIGSIALKAMAKEPADRYESMSEFAKALKDYVTRAEDKTAADPAAIAVSEPIREKAEQPIDIPHETTATAEAFADTDKIEFSCPLCRLPVRTPSSTAGKKGMCPNCGAVVPIPRQSTRRSSQEAPSGRHGLVAQQQQKTTDTTAVSIEFTCPQCQRLVRTPAGTAGKKGKCPGCGRVVNIPVVKSV